MTQLYSQQYTRRPSRPQKGFVGMYVAMGHIRVCRAFQSFWLACEYTAVSITESSYLWCREQVSKYDNLSSLVEAYQTSAKRCRSHVHPLLWLWAPLYHHRYGPWVGRGGSKSCISKVLLGFVTKVLVKARLKLCGIPCLEAQHP